MTNADKVAFPRLPGTTRRTQPPKVVFIKSEDDKKNVEEVETLIKQVVKQSQLGINVKRVTKTARGVMIETEGAEQLERIAQSDDLKKAGLIVEKPKKRLPRVMIYDVDPVEDEDEVMKRYIGRISKVAPSLTN